MSPWFDLPQYGAYDRTAIQNLGFATCDVRRPSGRAGRRRESNKAGQDMIPMRRRAVVWLMASGAFLTPSPLRAAQDKPASAAPATSEQQDAALLQQAVNTA